MIKSPKLWLDALEKPQRKKVARAELVAEMHAAEVDETGMRLLSDKKPKKEDEIIPGRLNRVMSRVDEVTDSEATELAYELR